MKFAFVAAERANQAVSTLCRVIARDRRQARQAELEGHVDSSSAPIAAACCARTRS